MIKYFMFLAIFMLENAQTPLVKTILPNTGFPGEKLVITGNNFNNIQSVSFNGQAGIFTVQNENTIITTIPNGVTKGKITVTNLDGSGLSSQDFITKIASSALAQRFQKISDTEGNFMGALTDYNGFGASVSNLGDLDGDGISDIAIGANEDSDGGPRRGAVWILFLTDSGTAKSHQKISDTAGSFTGVLDNSDYFGESVTNLGDLDGDGISDLAVGAFLDDDGGFQRGAVWILFLNQNGTVKSHQKISDTEGNFTGVLNINAYFGRAIVNLGDLDGDGITDIAVGANGNDGGGTQRGAVWILFLNQNGTVKSHQKISDAEGNFTGVLSNYGWFGNSLTNLGDLDGDGVSDLGVGSSQDVNGRGALWILLLNQNGTVKSHQKISDIEGNFTGTLDNSDNFASTVANLGDLDGDGINDLVVGASRDDDGGGYYADRGALWILFLNQNGTVKRHRKISDTEGNFTGVLGNGDRFGQSVTNLGDLDGDGLTDLAVGADGNDGGTRRGTVWILNLAPPLPEVTTFSPNTGFSGEKLVITGNNLIDVQSVSFNGTAAAFTVQNANTIIATVPEGASQGKITVTSTTGSGQSNQDFIPKKASSGLVQRFQKISDTEGNFSGFLDDYDSFGSSLTNLGDLDGDGISDLAVGASSDDDGGVGHGAVWILFMNTDGTVKSDQKISDTDGNFAGDLSDHNWFGSSVSNLGDIDGDGVTDLVVGGIQYNGRGAVWVLFLNTDGTVKGHQKISDNEGNFTGFLDNSDDFGHSVANLGDLDGDGINELAVGVQNDRDGGPGRGAVWVLFLTDSGTVKSHQKISDTEGNFTGILDDYDSFGQSVTNLGDLDGDGINDLAVGASSDDDGGAGRGAVWILFLNQNGTVKSHQKISDTDGNFAGDLSDHNWFGSSVSNLGDINGDGITDLAVGARSDDDGGGNRGAVWVLFLNQNGTVKNHQKLSDTSGNFTGILDDYDSFGQSVTNLGDLDGDGISDLAVGASSDDGGEDRGAVWILNLATQTAASIAVNSVIDIRSNSAILSGLVTDDGGSPVTERGFVWGLSAYPKFSDNFLQVGSGNGVFTDTIVSLANNTNIFYRSYAINAVDTSYTETESYGNVSRINHGSGNQYSSFYDGLNFTVTGRAVYIDSLTVYPVGTGNLVIRITTSSDVNVESRTIPISGATGTALRVPIEIYLQAGSYKIDASGSTISSLFRSTSGSSFPYTDPSSSFSITRNINNLSAFWYFFYDWKISFPDNFTTISRLDSLNRSSSISSNSRMIDYSIDFADPVSGLNIGHFSPVIVGVLGNPQIVSLTGTGSSYTIRMSTAYGTGTIGLNMVDSAGINPKLDNIPFIGQTYTMIDNAPVISVIKNDTILDEDFSSFQYNINKIFEDDRSADSTLHLSVSSGNLFNSTLKDSILTISAIEDANGVDSLFLRARDQADNIAYDTLVVTINPVNDQPIVTNAINDTVVSEDFSLFSYNLNTVFEDTETADTNLTYSLLTSHGSILNASIAGQNLNISSINNANGVDTVIVQATDDDNLNSLSIRDSIVFTVDALNDQPIVTNAINDTVVSEDFSLFSYNLNTVFEDMETPDADLTFSLLTSHGSILNASIAGQNLNISSINNANGVDTVIVQATDDDCLNTLSVADTLIVTVNALAPVVKTILPNTGFPGEKLVLIGDHFTNIQSVSFNGVSATFTVQNENTIITTVPEGTAQGKITVRNTIGFGFSNQDFIPRIVSSGLVQSFQKISDSAGNFIGNLDDVDFFGSSVTNLGDLDGDGIADLAVGAFRDDDGGAGHGAVWILFLNVDGTVKSHQKISDTEGNFIGILNNYDGFGSSVTNLGDLDGDGIVDLAVGARGDDDGGAGRGAVWILFLNQNGTVKSHQKISGTEGNFAGPLDKHNFFGSSVTNLGDLDGDGIVDLAVGADGDNIRGAVWILFMNEDGTVKSHQKISGTEGNFTGDLDIGDWFGFSVTNLGDLDGDGIVDLAVGAYNNNIRGAVWILFMNNDGTVKSHQKISDTEGNFTGILDNGDQFGFSVTNLGDLDGDGIVDLAVGAVRDDDGGDGRGAVWILFMNTDGTVKSHQKISDTEGNFAGPLDNHNYFASSLTNLGDLDGDGINELAVGVVNDNDGGSGRGAVWLLSLASQTRPFIVNAVNDTILSEDFTLFSYDLYDIFEDQETVDSNLTYQLISSHGLLSTVNINSDSLSITSISNAFGMDTIIIQASDDAVNQLSVNDTVIITINAVNDQPIVTNEFNDTALVEDFISFSYDLHSVFEDIETNDSSMIYSLLTNHGSILNVNLSLNTLFISSILNANGMDTLIVQATDDDAVNPLSITDTLIVTVNAINDQPVVMNTISDTTLTEDFSTYSYNLNNVFDDIETADVNLIYSLLSTHGIVLNASISANSLNLSSIKNINGMDTLIVEAVDDDGINPLSVQDTLIVTIDPVNDQPVVADAINDTTLNEDFSTYLYNLDNVFDDIETADANLSYSLLSTHGSVLNASISGNSIDLSSVVNASGMDTLIVQATDDNAVNPLSVADTVIITVNAVNDQPLVVNAISDTTLTEDFNSYSYNLNIVFEDIETSDANLSYNLLSNHGTVLNASISTNSLNLSSILNINGMDTLILQAMDDDGVNPLSAVDTVIVTISGVNDAPIVATAISDTVLNEDFSSYSYNLDDVFEDIETSDANLVYSLLTTNGAVLNASISGNSLDLSSILNINGMDTLIVQATDDDGLNPLSITDTLIVTVNAVNDQPLVVNAINDTTLTEDFNNYSYNLNNVFEDIETADSDLIYSLISSHGSVLNAGIVGNSLELSSILNANGRDTVILRARDEGGLSVEETFIVRVGATNDAPVILSDIIDQVLAEDFGSYTIDLHNFFSDTEEESRNLTYTATNQNLLSLRISGSQASIESILNEHGTANISFRATDSEGLFAEQTVSFTVSPVNDPPSITTAIGNRQIKSGERLEIDLRNHFRDIDGDLLNYSYTLSDNSIAFTLNSDLIEIRDQKRDQGKKVSVMIRGEDGNGLAAEQSFEVEYVSNDGVELLQNRPNPFNPNNSATEFRYRLKANGNVYLAIYSESGRRVKTLVNEFQGFGYYQNISWDGKDEQNRSVPSGVYYFILSQNGKQINKALTVIR